MLHSLVQEHFSPPSLPRPLPLGPLPQGQFQFRFSLVYSSLEDVLPGVEELRLLAQQDGSKEERAQAQRRLAEIIQVRVSQ